MIADETNLISDFFPSSSFQVKFTRVPCARIKEGILKKVEAEKREKNHKRRQMRVINEIGTV